jgi:hypothetical protein
MKVGAFGPGPEGSVVYTRSSWGDEPAGVYLSPLR